MAITHFTQEEQREIREIVGGTPIEQMPEVESFTDNDLVPFIKVTGGNDNPVKSAAVIKATSIGGGGSGSGEVTGVKGDAEESFRRGNVEITKENIGLGNVDDKSANTLKSEIMTAANVKSVLGCQQGGTKYLKEDGSWDTPAGGGGGGGTGTVTGVKVGSGGSTISPDGNGVVQIPVYETGAEKNVKPDWNAESGSAAEILNKPTIPQGTVTGAKVGDSGSTISPVNGIVTLPSYETGAQKNPTAYIKSAEVSQDGNSLTITKQDDSRITFTPAGGGGGGSGISPYGNTPAMDSGNGSSGSSEAYSRGDHVHPSDTTKADKSEMSVTPGTGDNADKTTIQLKSGMSATVLTQHQDISGKADKSATVSTVTYDTSNKKITKTINGVTSDVVTASTLKTDMALNNVGNFKAVSTVASQGLTATEKTNARNNIGAGTSNLSIGTTSGTAADGKVVNDHTTNTTVHITSSERTAWNGKYEKPSTGIPESDFSQDVRDKLLVKNLSCEPMFGISEAEILGASRYGLMQSMVATENYVLGFIHQQPQSGESYANALFCALFDHSGNYLGKSNLNVSNFHANDATIIGSYVYICNGGPSSSTGIRRISTSTLISRCKSGSTSSTTLESSISATSMDYDATNNDVCVYDGDLKIYNTSFSLKRTAVTRPETKIRSKFGSFINTIVWQGLVYKDNKAYTLNVAEMSEKVNCTIMCVFDLVTGDIINVYRVPAFSSWMEIQGCFKNPLKDDEILASYDIWSHGSLDGSWGVAINGVLRISLSGMVASPTSSIRVDNPSFDEMNSQRTVYIDNTYYGTDSFSYSLGTKEAPFKRIEDAYQVVAGASNVSFMLANTSKTYQVYDRITARNATISIETWSKYSSGPSKATLASVFQIDHGSLKLDNLSISLGSSQSADVGNSAFFNFRESGFRMANCDISVTTTIKDNIFAAINSKLTIFTNCSLSTRTGVMFLWGNSEVNFFNNPTGSIDTISIYCGTFINCYSTGNKVYADVRCLSDLSDITTLVNLSRCTEPVLYISNANLPDQATPLKASCVSSSSRGSIAVVQDGSWVDTMGKGVYTNDTSYGTVEGYVFFERTTGIPLVYRKKGTTSQRPDLSGYTGKDAIPYNNTTTGKVEFWNGSSWV